MSFLRSNSGISNTPLFYDSDIIIYTEGGNRSLSAEEVDQGDYETKSIDIKFWSGVLKANGLKKKATYRAIGSKTSSNAMVEKIASGKVKNIALARDSDLDKLIGPVIKSPFLLYTKGYSWENDVFSKEITIDQIESMILEEKVPESVTQEIDDAFRKFSIIGKHLAKLEIIFRLNGIKFISELNGERFFNFKNSYEINKNEIKKILEEKKLQIPRPATPIHSRNNICPHRDTYGKLIKALSLKVLSYICKKYSHQKTLPNDLLETSMIERYINKILKHQDDYYSELTRDLNAA